MEHSASPIAHDGASPIAHDGASPIAHDGALAPKPRVNLISLACRKRRRRVDGEQGEMIVFDGLR